GGNPFGFLQPHGSNRRRILDPTKTRLHSRVLLLIGLENLGICAHLRAHGGGEHRPAIVLLRVGQSLYLHDYAVASLCCWRVCCRGTSPTGAARTPGIRHDVIADRMIPPGAWATAAAPLVPARILRNRGGGVRPADKPPRLDPLPVVSHGV